MRRRRAWAAAKPRAWHAETYRVDSLSTQARDSYFMPFVLLSFRRALARRTHRLGSGDVCGNCFQDHVRAPRLHYRPRSIRPGSEGADVASLQLTAPLASVHCWCVAGVSVEVSCQTLELVSHIARGPVKSLCYLGPAHTLTGQHFKHDHYLTVVPFTGVLVEASHVTRTREGPFPLGVCWQGQRSSTGPAPTAPAPPTTGQPTEGHLALEARSHIPQHGPTQSTRLLQPR